MLQTDQPEPIEFKIRPEKVKEALRWLVKNNPVYKHIKISDENLKVYEDKGGQFDPLTMEYDWTPDAQKQAEKEATDEPVNEREKKKEKDLNGDVQCPSSVAPLETPTDNLEELLAKVFKAKDPKDLEDAKFSFPKTIGEPLSEFKPRYYAKCFPHLFPNGEGDYNMPRLGDTPGFKDWCQHLMKFHDGRFVKDPIFSMVVANQAQRRTALSLGNVIAKRTVGNKTCDELRKDFEDGKTEVTDNVRYFGKSLDGSSQYFYNHSNNSLALMDHIRLKSDDTEAFNVFSTFSAADMHWDDLHRLLPESEQYLDKIVVKSLDGIKEEDLAKYITAEQDFLLRSKAIENNAAIATDYFIERLEALFDEVLIPVYGLRDYIVRYEFQHR